MDEYYIKGLLKGDAPGIPAVELINSELHAWLFNQVLAAIEPFVLSICRNGAPSSREYEVIECIPSSGKLMIVVMTEEVDSTFRGVGNEIRVCLGTDKSWHIHSLGVACEPTQNLTDLASKIAYYTTGRRHVQSYETAHATLRLASSLAGILAAYTLQVNQMTATLNRSNETIRAMIGRTSL